MPIIDKNGHPRIVLINPYKDEDATSRPGADTTSRHRDISRTPPRVSNIDLERELAEFDSNTPPPRQDPVMPSLAQIVNRRIEIIKADPDSSYRNLDNREALTSSAQEKILSEQEVLRKMKMLDKEVGWLYDQCSVLTENQLRASALLSLGFKDFADNKLIFGMVTAKESFVARQFNEELTSKGLLLAQCEMELLESTRRAAEEFGQFGDKDAFKEARDAARGFFFLLRHLTSIDERNEAIPRKIYVKSVLDNIIERLVRDDDPTMYSDEYNSSDYLDQEDLETVGSEDVSKERFFVGARRKLISVKNEDGSTRTAVVNYGGTDYVTTYYFSPSVREAAQKLRSRM